MRFTVSIKNNYEFKRLYNRGVSAAAGYIVVYLRRTKNDYSRLGITVSTKVGGAVQRNRARRLIKEVYRLNEDKVQKGIEIVVVARVRANGATYKNIEKDFFALGKKLNIFKT